jgi:hypothetical protein
VNLCRDNWRRAATRPRELPLLPGAGSVSAVDGPADRIGPRRDLVSALALLRSRATGYFTIFLERGKNLGPQLARRTG